MSQSKASTMDDYWFPIGLGAASGLFLLTVISFVWFCCRNRCKTIEKGELQRETEEKNNTTCTKTKPTFISSSPIQGRNSRNSYSVSPKKGFSYSPPKNLAPIFSFTSPQKYVDQVVYPSQSPMDTATPFHVQPKVNLLFPVNSTPANDNNSRKWSGSTSMNSSEKSKSLYQSRRGSSASLIIDISPKSPVAPTYSPISESPTEEILLRKSRSLNYRELQLAKDNVQELRDEFWTIPPNTVSRKDSQMRFTLKNRYPDILPNSRSMVRLKDEDESLIYMNANFISGRNGAPNQYIATQGPLACTVSDFWLMIWQCNCSIIIMITKLKEKNKEKCVQYWPSPDTISQQSFGNLTVTCDSEIERDGYRITTLYISYKGSEETRKITHFWMTEWPDHKAPKEHDQVLSLVKGVQQMKNSSSKAPIVIHCSAGRGRTGCFIALDLGINQIDDHNEVDILKIVSRIRIERGGLVDRDSQYIFIYKTLYEYWKSKINITSTPRSGSIFHSTFMDGEDINEIKEFDYDSPQPLH